MCCLSLVASRPGRPRVVAHYAPAFGPLGVDSPADGCSLVGMTTPDGVCMVLREHYGWTVSRGRKLGSGTACDRSRWIVSDPAGANVCRWIRASYRVHPYGLRGSRRIQHGHQLIGDSSAVWVVA